MIRALLFIVCSANLVIAQDTSLAASLKTLNSVGAGGRNHADANKAWKQVSRAGTESIPLILASIDDTKPLAANWIRSVVDQIAERAIRNGRSLPARELEKIVFDDQYSPRARRLAYEWLVKVDAKAEQRIIPNMLNDDSIEMRRDAVALVISQAESAESLAKSKDQYRVALTSARDQDQIDLAYDKLVELGESFDLSSHFGFITNWHLIGPFDNTNKGGFDVAYPPEREISLSNEYQGKKGKVTWLAHRSDDKYGMVDLNTAIGKNMGAAGYAYTEFVSPGEQEVDLRLGCICAAKIWLNGKQLMEHEVYHAGTKIDQYIARAKLRAGTNKILVKICQNEQTDSWAQDWQFQLRVCDQVGTAILSQDRVR